VNVIEFVSRKNDS